MGLIETFEGKRSILQFFSQQYYDLQAIYIDTLSMLYTLSTTSIYYHMEVINLVLKVTHFFKLLYHFIRHFFWFGIE